MADELLPTPAGEPPFHHPKRVTGVVILSTSLQPLYIDQRAQDLCEHLWIEEDPAVARRALPQALLDYSREVLQVLEVCLEANTCERFMMKHVSMPSKRQIIIRGLGLPHRNGFTQSRILLYLEDWAESPLAASDRLRYRFLLDDRDPTSSASDNSHSASGNGSDL